MAFGFWKKNVQHKFCDGLKCNKLPQLLKICRQLSDTVAKICFHGYSCRAVVQPAEGQRFYPWTLESLQVSLSKYQTSVTRKKLFNWKYDQRILGKRTGMCLFAEGDRVLETEVGHSRTVSVQSERWCNLDVSERCFSLEPGQSWSSFLKTHARKNSQYHLKS